MGIKLTWDDLIIQNFKSDDVLAWLGEWNWLVTGEVSPIFLSKFGSWFLQRRDGRVEKLDVLEGTCSTIATSLSDFRGQVNTQHWQEEHLLSLMVYRLHEEGKIPGPSECYGFVPHPMFTQKIEHEQVTILSIRVWQTICAQLFQAQS